MIRLALSLLAVAQTTFDPSIINGQKIGDWSIEQGKDTMTDIVSTSVHVRSGEAQLDYGCNSGRGARTMFILTTTAFLGGVRGDNFRRVLFRVDAGQPVNVTWKYGDNYAFASFHDVMDPVINAMAAGKKLAVRVTTYRGEQVDTEFSIDGAARAFAFVDNNCLSK